MIYTVTLNPALDKTVEVPGFALDAVNRAAAVRRDAGGKGINVAKTVRALGGECGAFCILGGAAGEDIRAETERLGIPVTACAAAGETRTNIKIVDRMRHTNTDLNEPGTPVPPQTLAQLYGLLRGAATPGDIVVLAGSLPPGAPAALYRDWAAGLAAAGVRVFLDAEGGALRCGLEARPYFVKPNRAELEALCGRPLPAAADAAAEAKALHAAGVRRVLVSLGGEGAGLACDGPGQGVLWAHGVTVPVSSRVGAGDTVVAAFACGEAAGLPAAETLRLAVAASAAAVALPGTQAPARAQVEALLPQVRVERME